MSLQVVLKNNPFLKHIFAKDAIRLLALNYHFIGIGLQMGRNNSEQIS